MGMDVFSFFFLFLCEQNGMGDMCVYMKIVYIERVWMLSSDCGDV